MIKEDYKAVLRLIAVHTYDVTLQLFPLSSPQNKLNKENLKRNIIHNGLFYYKIKSFTFINTFLDHPHTYTYTHALKKVAQKKNESTNGQTLKSKKPTRHTHG